MTSFGLKIIHILYDIYAVFRDQKKVNHSMAFYSVLQGLPRLGLVRQKVLRTAGLPIGKCVHQVNICFIK